MNVFDDKYQPLSKMQPYMRREGQSVPCKIYLAATDIIDGGQRSDEAVDLLLRLFGNNKFYVTNNGSFHEYNISLWTLPSKGYFYNKYSARDNDYESRKKFYTPVDDDLYVSDHSVVYIDDDLYNICNRYQDVDWFLANNYENNTPDKMHSSYDNVRLITPSELPEILEKETAIAVRNWKLSKEAYNESATPKAQMEGLPQEETEDEDQASQITLLCGKTRYNGVEVRPKNWNGTAWV